MPEDAVDEHGESLTREDNVHSDAMPGHVNCVVLSEPEATAVEGGSHRPLAASARCDGCPSSPAVAAALLGCGYESP